MEKTTNGLNSMRYCVLFSQMDVFDLNACSFNSINSMKINRFYVITLISVSTDKKKKKNKNAMHIYVCKLELNKNVFVFIRFL